MAKAQGKVKKISHKKSVMLCVVIPLIACLIFMVLCMLNLTSTIWFDESYSAYLVRGNFGDIWNMTSLDVHPPLFYFLLKIWSSIFGYTDFSMRFMSIFFGAVAIIFTFHLLKRWFNIKTAGIAVIALSLSPMLIRYGQEMRMYTLVFAIIMAATYVLDLMLETKKTRYYILYAVLIALGMWTHYFAAIAWIAHIIYYTVSKRAKLFSKPMLLTYILAVALFIPWLPSLFRQIIEVQSGFWIPSISMATPVSYMTEALMFSEAEYATGWLVLLCLGATILTTYFLRKIYVTQNKVERSKFWLLISIIAIPPIILIILSLPPLTSMFIDRYILYSAALIWTLIGMAIAFAFSKKWLKNSTVFQKLLAIVLFISVAGCAITGIVNVENRKTEGFVKNIVSSTKLVSEPGIPILANNEWNYYDAVFYSSEEHPIYGVDEWMNYQYGSIFPIKHIGYNLIDNLDDFMSSHDKIWYITDLNDSTRNGELDKEVLNNKYQIVTTIADDRMVAFELVKK